MIDPEILAFYSSEVAGQIVRHYAYSEKKAVEAFLLSETYQMLIDENLDMTALSPLAIFDLWENEHATGEPRNSLYIKGEY